VTIHHCCLYLALFYWQKIIEFIICV
jgi:hypothetical protein